MNSLLRIIRQGLVALLLAALLTGGSLTAQNLPGHPVDLAQLNPLIDIVLPKLYPIIAMDVSPSLGDATLINRINMVVALGMMDAAAPYHETAVGMYSRSPRRPESERTDFNINSAMLYGAYQVLQGLLPQRDSVWRAMLSEQGLDPDDRSSDPSTPVGIGNIAGWGAVAGRLRDGMNQLGHYQDNTGYMPVNSAYVLRDPSRWQPGLRLQGTGVYTIQQFVTPQLANTEPVGAFDPREFRARPPIASDAENWEAYQEQADAVLAVSAELTEEQKLKAELFDNKILSLGLSFIHLAQERNWSPADTARGYFLKTAAALDGSIVTWQEKARYDAVRPFSAIRHIYGDELVRAWGGPGAGAGEIPASQWRSYLPEADHPEYPSGSTCGCYAQAQAVRRFSGADELNWTVAYPAGSSRIEPGLSPAEDLTLRFATWTDFARDCGQSRVWAGVHFPAAVEASAAVCGGFGDLAYEYFSALMDGTAPERPLAQPLAADPWLTAARAQEPEPIVVAPSTTPTSESCRAVSESIIVTAVNSGVECHPLDMSGLGLLESGLDAVKLSGELSLGAQICFRAGGSLIFFDDASSPPIMTQLATYGLPDMVCGWINQTGTVMLISADLGKAVGNAVRPLSECQVVSLEYLSFRDAPGGRRIGIVIPSGHRLTATARTPGSFKVQYGGEVGWISADFVRAEGACA
ncbi:MAG: vanadium-dependent haloperoxidase [Chloroflexota bacterium]|nr:vanadium-dependent haloperoxidase [Chloroflexota bacterium]MDE2855186.1 vanadium-dependent haloperoxidase [Chloroflexota bacterium]MDE2945798.1 vanadium-dependent haloperoxidase [Chloroflexota bacterium]